MNRNCVKFGSYNGKNSRKTIELENENSVRYMIKNGKDKKRLKYSVFG